MENLKFKTKFKLCLASFGLFVSSFTMAMWFSVNVIPYALGIFAVLGLVVTFLVSILAKRNVTLFVNLAVNAVLTGLSIGALFPLLGVPYVLSENLCFAAGAILLLVVHLLFLSNKENPSKMTVLVFVVIVAILIGFCVSEPSELTIYLSVYFLLYAVYLSGFILGNNSTKSFVNTMELCSFTILMFAFVAVIILLFGKEIDLPTIGGSGKKGSSKSQKKK